MNSVKLLNLAFGGLILSKKIETYKLMSVPQAMEGNCELLYLHTEFYSPEHEGGVRYNDPKIGIKWPLGVTDISERDKNHPLLGEDFLVIEF